MYKNFIQPHLITFLLVFLSIVLYYFFAYHIVRTNYTSLLLSYVCLFSLFYFLVKTQFNNFVFLATIAILFRFIFLVAFPNLSQDFYRFIWDGRMLLNGTNPYLFTPLSFIEQNNYPIADAQQLFNGMGQLNASHFTNYPPLNQLCFAFANLFNQQGILSPVIIMRLQLILADIGILYFGRKLLQRLSIHSSAIFWYLLNPFVIIEFTGNLHYESVMLFFLIWSIYLLHINKWQWAAVLIALSVAVKLIPLIFLPLFYQKFGFKKTLLFYIIVGITVLAAFIPFFNPTFIHNYSKTVGLWFQNFEFNASIYYLARTVGYWFRGYNEIALIGKIIPIVVLVFIIGITFFRENKTTKQLLTTMLFVLSFYFFTSTTVHPWYLSTILLLSIFTPYRYVLVWSFTVILSYLAYINPNYGENLWIIGLEYGVVYGVLIYELVLVKMSSKAENKKLLR